MLEWIQRLPPWLWIALIVFSTVMGIVAYLILLERKVASWVQDRLGPNRVGPKGLLQPMADGLKFVVKEDYRPGGADARLFTLAPMLMIVVMIVSVTVIPWGGIKQSTKVITVPAGQDPQAVAQADVPWGSTVVNVAAQAPGAAVETGDYAVTYRYPFQIASLNIGVLFIVAVLSLAVYGVVVGGWASNNKYSFLGGLRATAQMISYEIPLGLSILTIVLMFGTLDLGQIVQRQAHYWAGFIPAWNVFTQPITFLMFLVCIHAEANRAPFDLAEAEQELVGGYHTEYSSMRFALFFLGEYAGMITTSAVCVALFFGGWHLPWIEWLWPALAGNVQGTEPALTTSLLACLVRMGVYFTKVLVVIFVFMWVRWSLPRFRFDQLMMLAWRAMIPISLGLLLVTAVIIWWLGASSELYATRHQISGPMALALLAGNVLLLAGAMVVSVFLPAPPDTNRRLPIANSRFARTPVPAG